MARGLSILPSNRLLVPRLRGRALGLSRISKALLDVFLFRCSEFHLTPDGSIIGVSPQDVERDAAHDSKVFRPVILAGSSVSFVEDDVEAPMQLILYAPMRARHFEHALRRQPFGQNHVVYLFGNLAVGVALGFDAADGGEVGKRGRVG